MNATLKDILPVTVTNSVQGDPSVPVRGVTHDSREVDAGSIFVALPGSKTDGYKFIRDAILAGACAIMAEKPCPPEFEPIAWVRVPDARKALGPVAAAVNGNPTTRLTLVGITGTNGKTTLTYLLEGILRAAGRNPGVIGTVTYRWGGRERPAGRTTPEASEIQSIFREMVEAGVTHGIIEASSHGLDMDRLDGCHFDLGVFTNLSRDHLDYHPDLEEYYQAKRLLFSRLLPASSKRDAAAVVNGDDPYGRRLADEIKDLPVMRFGTSEEFEAHTKEPDLRAEGIAAVISTPDGTIPVRSSLTGSFNLSNLLAAVAVSGALGIGSRAIAEGIEAVQVVPGRLENIPAEAGNVYVDYAHTPQALQNVLAALAAIRRGRIITIMGCGGDRDKAKRPMMGKEAARGSDFVVVTSDNPRSEDPDAIIEHVVEGVQEAGFEPSPGHLNGAPMKTGFYRVMPDRREAITWAVKNLLDGDILLVAGKGHETYQEIGGVRHTFDDRVVVRDALRARSRERNSESSREEAEAGTIPGRRGQ